jgi:EpsI family protein
MTSGQRFLIAACALAVAAATLRIQAATEAPIPDARLEMLSVPGAEVVGDERLDVETERVLQADQYLLRSFESGGLPMDVFVAFYGSQRSGHTIHSPLNCLPGTGWTWAQRDREDIPASGGGTMTVNRNIATRNGDSLLVYYWYQSRGRVTASDYRNKLLLVRDAALLHRSDGALVRVTTPWPLDSNASGEPRAFLRNLHTALAEHLPE